MFVESEPADPRTHEAAMQMARACRNIVQACLREEEFAEADRQFYRVIRAGPETYRAKDGR